MIVDPLPTVSAAKRNLPAAGQIERKGRRDAKGLVNGREGRLAFVEIATCHRRKCQVAPTDIVDSVDREGQAAAQVLMSAGNHAVMAQRRVQIEPRGACRGIGPLARADRAVAAIFIGCKQPARCPFAPGQRAILLLEIASVRGSGQTRAGFQAVIVTAQDEVGDAGDRVRAVDRRGAVRYDLDAINSGNRDPRYIDALPNCRIGETATIEQRQGRIAAKAAQVDGRSAANVDAAGVGDIHADPGVLSASEALRDTADNVAQPSLAGIANLFLTDPDDRRSNRGTAQPAPRDDDILPAICRTVITACAGLPHGKAAINRRVGEPGLVEQDAQRFLDGVGTVKRRGLLARHDFAVDQHGDAGLKCQRLERRAQILRRHFKGMALYVLASRDRRARHQRDGSDAVEQIFCVKSNHYPVSPPGHVVAGWRGDAGF